VGEKVGGERLWAPAVWRSGERRFWARAWSPFGPMGPGPFSMELGSALFKWDGWSPRAGPFNLFLLFTSFLIIPKLRFQKYKSQSYLTPTLFKFGKLIDKFQANKLPFWLDFQFPLDFELKIQETYQISKLFEF
jgi:hypothetical protein